MSITREEYMDRVRRAVRRAAAARNVYYRTSTRGHYIHYRFYSDVECTRLLTKSYLYYTPDETEGSTQFYVDARANMCVNVTVSTPKHNLMQFYPNLRRKHG